MRGNFLQSITINTFVYTIAKFYAVREVYYINNTKYITVNWEQKTII